MNDKFFTDDKQPRVENCAKEQDPEHIGLTPEEKKELELIDAQVKEYLEQHKQEIVDTEKRDRRYYDFICDSLRDQIEKCENMEDKSKLEKMLAFLTELGSDSYARNQVWRDCYDLFTTKFSKSDGGQIEYMQCSSKGDSFNYSDDDISEISNAVDAYLKRYFNPRYVYELVFGYIDEKGFKKPSDVYKKINMSKALWHNIVDPTRDHRPQKNNIIRIALGLQLDLDEAHLLLKAAGYAFDYTAFDNALEAIFEKGLYCYPAIQEYLNRNFGKCLEKDDGKKVRSSKDEKF